MQCPRRAPTRVPISIKLAKKRVLRPISPYGLNTGSLSPYFAIAQYGLFIALFRYRSIRARGLRLCARAFRPCAHTPALPCYVLATLCAYARLFRLKHPTLVCIIDYRTIIIDQATELFQDIWMRGGDIRPLHIVVGRIESIDGIRKHCRKIVRFDHRIAIFRIDRDASIRRPQIVARKDVVVVYIERRQNRRRDVGMRSGGNALRRAKAASSRSCRGRRASANPTDPAKK